MGTLLSYADLVGGVLFGLTSVVVGFRLLWLSRRTGELPELLIGLAFAVAGFAGYLLGILHLLVELPDTLETLLPYVSRALIDAGSVLIAVATWRIFHAGSARALAAVVGLSVLLVFDVFPLSLGSLDRDFLVERGFRLLAMLPYVWMTVASLRLRQQLLKRWRIGLGDPEPELARRLLLWGLGTVAVAGLFFTDQIVLSVHEYTAIRLPQELFVALWGTTCATCMWLAFFGRSARDSSVGAA